MDRILQYNQQMEKLRSRWKEKAPKGNIDHSKNIFVMDGVVCPERWFGQEVRPLFLLKEAYGWKTDGDLIKDHLKTDERIKKSTWRRVTRWAYGLLNTTAEHICPFGVNDESMYFGNEYLQRIAAVNIKKSNGQKSSDKAEILQYAEYDKAELLEQIKIIDPTVIVCGYTISALNIIMPQPVKNYDAPEENLFYFTTVNGHQVIVLDYWHPSNRYPLHMDYYGLMGIYQQALIAQEKG